MHPLLAQDFACEQVLVAGQFAGLEGRLDHTMAAFNALLKAAMGNPKPKSQGSA